MARGIGDRFLFRPLLRRPMAQVQSPSTHRLYSHPGHAAAKAWSTISQLGLGVFREAFDVQYLPQARVTVCLVHESFAAAWEAVAREDGWRYEPQGNP